MRTVGAGLKQVCSDPGRHHGRRIGLLGVGLALLTVGLAACGGGGATATSPPVVSATTPTTTAPAPPAPPTSRVPAGTAQAVSPEAEKMVIVDAQNTRYYAVSDIVRHGGEQWFALAVGDSHSNTFGPVLVSIYKWAGDHWMREDPSVPLNTGALEPHDDPAPPVKVAFLTGSQTPEFLVQTIGATTSYISVISAVTGDWAVVRFRPAEAVGPVAETVPFGEVMGETVLGKYNNCLPDCAEGTYIPQEFRYDKDLNLFVLTPESEAATAATTTTTTVADDPFELLQGTWSAEGFTVTISPDPSNPSALTTNLGGEGVPGQNAVAFSGVQATDGILILTYDFTTDPNTVFVDDGSSMFSATRS